MSSSRLLKLEVVIVLNIEQLRRGHCQNPFNTNNKVIVV
jgi:hypothetical protein